MTQLAIDTALPQSLDALKATIVKDSKVNSEAALVSAIDQIVNSIDGTVSKHKEGITDEMAAFGFFRALNMSSRTSNWHRFGEILWQRYGELGAFKPSRGNPSPMIPHEMEERLLESLIRRIDIGLTTPRHFLRRSSRGTACRAYKGQGTQVLPRGNRTMWEIS